MKPFIALLPLFLSVPAFSASDDIALNEQGFLDAIHSLDTARLVDLVGEPAHAVEIKNAQGETIGRIWHFQYLNTTEEGEYYKVTELDIVGDRVVQVVFSNADTFDSGTAMAAIEECPKTC